MIKASILASLAVAIMAPSVQAAAGFLPTVIFQGNSCSGNALRGFAAGGVTDFQKWANCSEYIANTPAISNIVDRCETVQGSDGLYSRKVACYGNDTFMPCFANITGPVGYASFGIYTNAACTLQDTTASTYAGATAIQEGICQPYDFSKPNDPPFITANCTSGAENFRMWQDSKCSVPLPGIGAQLLNQQCNAFPFVNGLYVRGRCNQCPPVAPPPPPPAGLSGGAIAGIVIGSLAALAALGGLAYALTRRKQEPTPDLPLEASKPVTTVKEVTVAKPVETVVTKEVVTQAAAPVVAQTTSYVAPVAATTVAAVAAAPVVSEAVKTVTTETSYTTTQVPVTDAVTTTTYTTQSVPATATQTVYTTETVPATTQTTTYTTEVSGTGLNPINQYAVGSQYTAAGSYLSQKPSELNVKLGDFIRVEEVNQDGWVKGFNLSTNQSGWFPLAALKGGY